MTEIKVLTILPETQGSVASGRPLTVAELFADLNELDSHPCLGQQLIVHPSPFLNLADLARADARDFESLGVLMWHS